MGVIEDMGFGSIEAFRQAMHNCNRVKAGLLVIGSSERTYERPLIGDWLAFDLAQVKDFDMAQPEDYDSEMPDNQGDGDATR